MTAQILVRLSAVLLSAFLTGHEVNAQTVNEFSTRAAVVVPNGAAIARATLPGPSIAALRIDLLPRQKCGEQDRTEARQGLRSHALSPTVAVARVSEASFDSAGAAGGRGAK